MEQKQRLIQKIDINTIDEDLQQPRQKFSQKEIIELAESIKEQGLLHPILVSPYYIEEDGGKIIGEKARGKKGARFLPLSGARRIRANKHNAETQIEAEIIYPKDNIDAFEKQFVANAMVKLPNVIEMADACHRYETEVKKANRTDINIIERLSKISGVTTTYIKNALRISNMKDKRTNDLIKKGKLGAYGGIEAQNAAKSKETFNGYMKAVEKHANKVEKINKEKPKKAGVLSKPKASSSVLDARHVPLRDIDEEKVMKLTPKKKEKIAEYKTTKYLKSKSAETKWEEDDEDEADFEGYLYDTQEFYKTVQNWNFKGLSKKQISKLIEVSEKITKHFKNAKK